MLHRSVLAWIVNLCTGLRLPRRKTLAELVFGAVRCRRASLSDIGRYVQIKTEFALRKLLGMLAESLLLIAEQNWG